MSTFAEAVTNQYETGITLTENGMPTFVTTDNSVLDLFGVIGSSRGKNITGVFENAYRADKVNTLKVLFWARDIRQGSGERQTFRDLMLWLEKNDPECVVRLLPLVAEYGRFDDLMIFTTPVVQKAAVSVFANAILEGNGLSGKWAERKGPNANMLRKALGMDPKTYRKTIVALTQVVESQMCAKDWTKINYSHVPSVASARYQKAFNRHDPVGYSAFKAAAVAGTVKMNAGAVYPYDVLKSIRYGDETAALAQWQNLPNYLGDDFILPMVDVSGSMTAPVGGSATTNCMDVALSLGLYLADKQTGPFKDMFLTFSGKSQIQQLTGNLLEKLKKMEKSEWDMNTSIESAFKEILRVATMGNVPQDQMPKAVIVFSDMEFDNASDGNSMAWDRAKQLFAANGYTCPKVIWWNLRARPNASNNPVKQHETGTALVSGFSPNILRSILASKTVTPYDVMMETLNSERYTPVEHAIG